MCFHQPHYISQNRLTRVSFQMENGWRRYQFRLVSIFHPCVSVKKNMIFIVRFVTVIMEMVWVLLHNSVLILEIFDPSQSGTYLESAAPWTDGQIFNAISNGSASGIMLGLKDRLSPEERWAIVLYLRALQDYVEVRQLYHQKVKVHDMSQCKKNLIIRL